MSFIDLYKGLHSELTQQGFPPSSRVLIYTLVGEFNSARWIDSLVFSERDLIQLTGLKKTTLHEAKHFLTSRRFINCTPFKNTFAYSLGDELKELLNRPSGDHLPSPDRPEVYRLPTSRRPVGDQKATTFENSNIHVREEDVKTEDKKTEDKRERDKSAPEKILKSDSDIEELLTKLWRENNGCRVTAELLSYFHTLVEKHGFEWTQDAIKYASAKYGGSYWDMTLDFLRKRVAEMEGVSTNGSCQPNPKVTPITSKPPEYTGNEPWLNRDPNKPRKVKRMCPRALHTLLVNRLKHFALNPKRSESEWFLFSRQSTGNSMSAIGAKCNEPTKSLLCVRGAKGIVSKRIRSGFNPLSASKTERFASARCLANTPVLIESRAVGG